MLWLAAPLGKSPGILITVLRKKSFCKIHEGNLEFVRLFAQCDHNPSENFYHSPTAPNHQINLETIFQ